MELTKILGLSYLVKRAQELFTGDTSKDNHSPHTKSLEISMCTVKTVFVAFCVIICRAKRRLGYALSDCAFAR